EDGIRDFHVTGVQTCALPIYTRNISGDWFYWYFSVQSETDREIHFVFSKHKIPSFGPAISQDGGETWQWMFDGLNKGMERFSFRSEERRVGKECGPPSSRYKL